MPYSGLVGQVMSVGKPDCAVMSRKHGDHCVHSSLAVLLYSAQRNGFSYKSDRTSERSRLSNCFSSFLLLAIAASRLHQVLPRRERVLNSQTQCSSIVHHC
jgi:hypothetical protein